MAVGLGLSLAIGMSPATRCDDHQCGPEGNFAAYIIWVTFGTLTGAGLLVFAAVGGARATHRPQTRPSRASHVGAETAVFNGANAPLLVRHTELSRHGA
ncbi:hypothetical protein SAMN02745121_08586 [Nannocystis exedens]|uniref:Uncharacterized protein n=1 Tax=Nannocystis exedens TaxID=54 RepID=A0A1I2IDD2_9BACT|nr:hypothetical protein [Nannocystis exedens]PCC73206.1 hypothetical protein NAEX_06294 [Nannocystis exedens]SFF39658.1 hypothetical protein SAMN02745121_08586 [Nannocystis exedens]